MSLLLQLASCTVICFTCGLGYLWLHDNYSLTSSRTHNDDTGHVLTDTELTDEPTQTHNATEGMFPVFSLLLA